MKYIKSQCMLNHSGKEMGLVTISFYHLKRQVTLDVLYENSRLTLPRPPSGSPVLSGS